MPAQNSNARYLIRIQLEGVVRPPIWRDVIVPANISLEWLHEVIQESMGWFNSHLHQFEQKGCYFAPADYEDPLPNTRDEAKVALCDVLKKPKDWIRYEYDFGDGWEHRITLKQILQDDDGDCVRCVKAKGGDVVEDCGGPLGLMELRKLKHAVEAEATGVDLESYAYYGLEDCEFEEADLELINEELESICSEGIDSGGLHPGATSSVPRNIGEFIDSDDDGDLEADDDGFEEFMSAMAGGEFGLDDDDDDDLDDYFEGEGDEEEFPEPYSELKADALAEFAQTLELAERVRAAQPWKKLWDRDIFAVEDPQTKELDIVSVLGRGKEVYAVHVHRAPTALQFWKQAFSPAGINPEMVMKTSNMVEVEFVNKGTLDSPDLDLYEHTRFAPPLSGRHRWIRFRSYRPRCFPWFSEAADLDVLRRGMQLTLRYVELMQQSEAPNSFLTSDLDPGTMPRSLKVFRLAEGSEAELSDSWQLEDVPVDWAHCGGQMPVFEPSDFECMRFAKMPKQDDIWELGTTCLTNGVMTAKGPVMPVLAMACSISGGHVPPQPEFTADAEISEAQSLWQCLVANIDAQGYCPTEIRVVTDEAFELLSPFAELAGIRLAQFEEYAMLGQLFEMLAMMPGPEEM
jgi:hypothetical protein